MVDRSSIAMYGELLGIVMAMILGKSKEVEDIIIYIDYVNVVNKLERDEKKESGN